MSKANILVVEDQDSIRHFVVKALEDEGHVVRGVESVREARVALERDMPDLAFLDLKLPDGSGLDLLREIKRIQPEVAVVLMTAFGELETAVEAMSAGAYWFMKKPFEQEELLALAGRALESQKMWLELRRLRHQAFADEDFLHSNSPSMQESYAIAEQVARGDTTSVLIDGESGTGKEYFANLIHRMSARHSQPFVEINCAAIPSELLESELFGHEKGAFTDARAQKLGLMEMAHGGTLFLDEIGEMAPQLQAKLLRVLETRTFRRVGGAVDITVDVRVVAATHRDLQKLVAEGRFREDLYFRLNVVPVLVPALRDRVSDIQPLAEHFIARFCRELGRPTARLHPAALDRMQAYRWPGNVRELRNIIERVVLLEAEDEIRAEHLPSELTHAATMVGGVVVAGEPFPAGVVRPLADIEKLAIEHALKVCDGNKTKAATLLGIARQTLRTKLKEYAIGDDGEDADPA